jgi:hypothetical protein
MKSMKTLQSDIKRGLQTNRALDELPTLRTGIALQPPVRRPKRDVNNQMPAILNQITEFLKSHGEVQYDAIRSHCLTHGPPSIEEYKSSHACNVISNVLPHCHAGMILQEQLTTTDQTQD